MIRVLFAFVFPQLYLLPARFLGLGVGAINTGERLPPKQLTAVEARLGDTVPSPSQLTTPLAFPATYLWPPYLLRRPCCGVRGRLLAGARYLGGEGVGSVRALQLKKLSPSLASLRQTVLGGDSIPFIY